MKTPCQIILFLLVTVIVNLKSDAENLRTGTSTAEQCSSHSNSLPRIHHDLRPDSRLASLERPRSRPGRIVKTLSPSVSKGCRLIAASEQVSADVGLRPGIYAANEPVKIHVLSQTSGWRLRVKCTNLRRQGSPITASEIFVGSEKPEHTEGLHKPYTIIEDGNTGETPISIPLLLQTTSRHEGGIYEGELIIQCFPTQGPGLPPLKIPVVVHAASRVHHTIQNNKVYFHVGKPGGRINATIDGRISADCSVWLRLSAADGPINRLPLLHRMTTAGNTAANNASITWRLRESGQDQARPPDSRAYDGKTIAWRLNGTPGDIRYELQCELASPMSQPPGDYGIRAEVYLSPHL